MLASITPLGERGRNQRFGVTATAYVIGSLLGGALIGTLAGTIGQVLSPSVAVVSVAVSAIVLVAAVFDTRVGGLRLPTIRRQVNEDWLPKFRGWVYGFGFGFQLGMGPVTIVTTGAVYAALACAVLTGSWFGGVLVGAAFGLARGLAIFAGARVRTPAQLVQLHRRFASYADVGAWATVVLLVAVGVAAGTTIGGTS